MLQLAWISSEFPEGMPWNPKRNGVKTMFLGKHHCSISEVAGSASSSLLSGRLKDCSIGIAFFMHSINSLTSLLASTEKASSSVKETR